MMYARTPEEAAQAGARAPPAFGAAGAGTVVDVIWSAPVGPPHDIAVEHFGFADGLSQPKVEGTWQVGADGDAEPADTVKPGEFILGYGNNDGVLTPGVLVDAADDPDEWLPPASEDGDVRDFARNGTFLVARQLSQDVAGFPDLHGYGCRRVGRPAHVAAGRARRGAHRGALAVRHAARRPPGHAERVYVRSRPARLRVPGGRAHPAGEPP
jgi:hypothetical protein